MLMNISNVSSYLPELNLKQLCSEPPVSFLYLLSFLRLVKRPRLQPILRHVHLHLPRLLIPGEGLICGGLLLHFYPVDLICVLLDLFRMDLIVSIHGRG